VFEEQLEICFIFNDVHAVHNGFGNYEWQMAKLRTAAMVRQGNPHEVTIFAACMQW
jgi:hypothetical protein